MQAQASPNQTTTATSQPDIVDVRTTPQPMPRGGFHQQIARLAATAAFASTAVAITLGGMAAASTPALAQPPVGVTPAPIAATWKQAVAAQPVDRPFELVPLLEAHHNTLDDIIGDNLTHARWHDSTAPQAAQWQYLSDCPETVTHADLPGGFGVLDNATMPAGRTRLVIDHVNRLPRGSAPQVMLAFENRTNQPETVDVERAGLDGNPATNLQRFLNDSNGEEAGGHFTLAPHHRRAVVLAATLPRYHGITGLIELSSTGPVQMQLALTPPGARDFTMGGSGHGTHDRPVLPAARNADDHVHARGLFGQPDQESAPLTVDLGAGRTVRTIISGDDAGWSSAARGAATARSNGGDYGMEHTLHLVLHNPANSAYGRAVVLLVPGGGTTAAITGDNLRQAVELMRHGKHQVAALPIYNGAVERGHDVHIDYHYYGVSETSTPVYLAVVPVSDSPS
jgi:hypothetical protein